ncbi:MAG: cytochrome c [Acidobacteriaceae bacterium]|nr:cytochrome c [Acidobacteriaceae bacterium]
MKMGMGFTLVLAMAATTATGTLAQGSGADTYKAKCAMCHSAAGTGNAGMKVPPFKSPELVKATSAELIEATTNGKGKMPAYKGKLTDAQIKDVVTYIRTLQK